MKQSAVNIFLSSDRNEWFDLCIELATLITKNAVEISEDMVNNQLSSSILACSDESELEYEALLAVLKEFYHVCVIIPPVIGSYTSPIKDSQSILDIISLRLLKNFSELYDYEFKEDLMTLFIGAYNIFAPTDDSMVIPRRLNRTLVEFYNNNAEDSIPDDSVIVDIFNAPLMAETVSNIMLLWSDLNDLSKIDI